MRTYRDIIQQEFTARIRRNPNYSLRAFARDLDILPSHLSLLLQAKKGISVAAASKIAQKLGLSDVECSYFCDSVSSLHNRSRLARESAKARLLRFEQNGEFNMLTLDAFSIIADWYHYAILELLEVDGAQGKVSWIAKALGLSEVVVLAALERLVRVGLMEQTSDRFKPTKNAQFITTPTDVPSRAKTMFHEQILELATKSLHRQKLEHRDFSSMTMAITKSRLPEAKERIKEFRRQLNRDFSSEGQKDSLYCLAIQFFDLMGAGA